jgi:hypothetical protein
MTDNRLTDLKEKITMITGSISMCWNPIPSGVFDSPEALAQISEIMQLVEAYAKDYSMDILQELHNFCTEISDDTIKIEDNNPTVNLYQRRYGIYSVRDKVTELLKLLTHRESKNG